MDLSRVKTIRIEHLDFLDIAQGSTRNPIAEAEIPEMLREAVRAGVQVILTDVEGRDAYRLILTKPGNFEYVPQD